MSRLMQGLFARLENEYEEGADLGGAPAVETQQAEPAEPAPAPAAGGEAEPKVEGDEPKTMLDAINKELDKSKEPEQKGEQVPPKAEDKKPGGEQKPEDLTQMPEGLSAKAQQRFTSLVSALKEKDTELEQVRQQAEQGQHYREQFDNVVKNIGATPDQMQNAAVFLKAYNSRDYETVYNMLVANLKEVSLAMGRPLDSLMEQVDPLQDFPDLREAVAGFQIGREQALEIARLRKAEGDRQHQANLEQGAIHAHQSQVMQWVHEKDDALATIGKMTAELAKTDPLYPMIEAQIMKNTDGLQTIIRDTPPSTWIPQIRMIYSQVKQVLQAQPRNTNGGPRPLSGGGGKPNGAVAEPKTMFEAMFPNR